MDLLYQIPGSTFLGYFILWCVACIVIGRLWIGNDGAKGYSPPSPSGIDPVSIAFLRGGEQEVIRTALFGLYHKNLLELNPAGREVYVKSLPLPEGHKLKKIEGSLHQFFLNERSSRELQNLAIQKEIRQTLSPFRKYLADMHLAKTPGGYGKAWSVFWTVLLIMEGLGAVKLLMGLSRHKPVAFLVILMIITAIVLFVALRPDRMATSLGRSYLKILQNHFGWMKDSIKQGKPLEGMDGAYAVAVFGTTILAGSLMYDMFSKAFAAPPTTTSSSSSDRDGGSSSDSDGGGGGCGGCGGD